MSNCCAAVVGAVTLVIAGLGAFPALAQWYEPGDYNQPYDETMAPEPGRVYGDVLPPLVAIPYGVPAEGRWDRFRARSFGGVRARRDRRLSWHSTITRRRELGRQGFEWKVAAGLGRTADLPTVTPLANLDNPPGAGAGAFHHAGPIWNRGPSPISPNKRCMPITERPAEYDGTLVKLCRAAARL